MLKWIKIAFRMDYMAFVTKNNNEIMMDHQIDSFCNYPRLSINRQLDVIMVAVMKRWEVL